MEIRIRPIVPEYRCFKLKDVSNESLNKLITWANDELSVHIKVSLNTNNKLDELIYCVYASPYFELYNYSDFHKKFVEEVN